jgi:nucleoside-diphosphate-sugar epimerase
VAQSIAFINRPVDGVVDEDSPVSSNAPDPWGASVRAVLALEDSVTGSSIEGVVLRYGFFYGPGSAFAPDGQRGEEVKARRFPIVGDGLGISPFIHIDDAASAAVAALEGGRTGVYNVVDDEPAHARDWLPLYAEALGARPPRKVPAWLARMVAGKEVLALASNPARPSNARFKTTFGWQPRYPSWRQGFRESLG